MNLSKFVKRSTYLKLKIRARGALEKLQDWLFNAAVAAVLVATVLLCWRVLNPPERLNFAPETVAAMQIAPSSLTELYAISLEEDLSFAWLVTLYSAENRFVSRPGGTLPTQLGEEFYNMRRRYHRGDIDKYYRLFSALFAEIENFPVPPMHSGKYIYSDSGTPRTFILDRANIRGRTPIVSMTAGQVKRAGWSEGYGYHALVATESGGRYLYSRLDNLEEQVRPGANISAGQIIGTMGAPGDSPAGLVVEISPGGFAQDFWVNPYAILRFYEILSDEKQNRPAV